MLMNFSCENYKSFKEKTAFSMLVDKGNELYGSNTYQQAGFDLLKNAVIYGKNASGKSNLFKALDKMREIVLKSTQEPPNYNLKVDCFLLSDNHCNMPTKFEIEFIIEDVIYKYGFKVFHNEIISEWLYKKEQKYVLLFKRKAPEKSSIVIIKKYEAEWRKYAEMTRRNTLFLSMMAFLACDFAIEIRNWFESLIIVKSDRFYPFLTNEYISRSIENKNKVLDFIQKANIGIDDIKLNNDISIDKLPKAFIEMLQKENPEITINEIKPMFADIKIVHKVFNAINEVVATTDFDFGKESDGTKKIYEFSSPILSALEHGGILFIDEFDTNLHPLLIDHIIKLFNSGFNIKNAQFIVISSNPLLLDSQDIRRDEFWFVDKDIYGASILNRLSDFNVRKDKNKLKAYLSGEFGSVPIFKD